MEANISCRVFSPEKWIYTCNCIEKMFYTSCHDKYMCRLGADWGVMVVSE